MNERRAAMRYDLSLSVVAHLVGEGGGASRLGKTRDISTQGVYFVINSDIRPGADLKLTMTVPAEVIGGTAVFIKATGRVVRVDKRSEDVGQPIGVAAVIELHEFVRNEAQESKQPPQKLSS